MPGNEAIVIPIIVDPNGAVAGLNVVGNAAQKTNIQFAGINLSGAKLGSVIKSIAGNMFSLNSIIGIGVTALASLATSFFLNEKSIRKNDEALNYLENSYDRFNKTLNDLVGDIAKETLKFSFLNDALNDSTLSIDYRNRVLAELTKTYPGYLDNLDKEKNAYENVSAAIKDSIVNLALKAEIKSYLPEVENLIGAMVKAQVELNQIKRLGFTKAGEKSFLNILPTEQEFKEQEKPLVDLINKNTKEVQRWQDFLKKMAGGSANLINSIFTLTPKEVKPIKVKTPKVEVDTREIVFINPTGIKIPKSEDFKVGQPKPTQGIQEFFNPAGSMFLKTIEHYNKQLDDAKKKWQALQDQQQKNAEQISGVLAPAFNNLFDAILKGESPLKAFFSSIGKSVTDLIQQLIQAAIRAAVLSLITGGATGGGVSFASAFKKITGFASGGLVTGPVSALVGEGMGTNRSNPEVVAPLDKLKSFFASMLPGNKNYSGIGRNMGTAGMNLALPAYVEVRQRGRDLVGVMAFENRSQNRTT